MSVGCPNQYDKSNIGNLCCDDAGGDDRRAKIQQRNHYFTMQTELLRSSILRGLCV